MLLKIRRSAALILVFVLLFALVSCGNKKKVLESTSAEKTVVAQIAGFDVPMELYRYIALNYKADYENGKSSDIWLGESGAALLSEVNANIDETLTFLYATISLCHEYGIEADDAFIIDTVNSLMETAYEDADNDYEAFAAYLRTYNMNDAVYRFLVRNDVLAEELLARMEQRGEIAVSDADLKAILKSDECIRVKQILVPSDNGKTDAENKARAEELYGMLLDGADFDELVQAYGGDLFMFNNPDGYYITRGSYHPEFEQAAFSLAVGETSGVVKTDAGWSIIRRYEKENSYLDAHFDNLADEYITGQYNLRLEEHQAALTVIPTDKMEDYTIFNLESTFRS